MQAMQLVEEETRRYRPSKNYLDFLQPPKATFEVCPMSRDSHVHIYGLVSMRVKVLLARLCTHVVHTPLTKKEGVVSKDYD